MKILPPRTRPPRIPIRRRHEPKPTRAWAQYRACLRWDFGFTCAFCLLHEADFFAGQTGEGLGVTTVEHAITRKADSSRAGDYSNCLYACRFCNRSRSARPRESNGARLLDPTRDAWSEHFVATGDELRPVAGDRDAHYTHRSYELDDPRKVERRRLRRELITDRLNLLSRFSEEIEDLLHLADLLRNRDLRLFGKVMRQIRTLRDDAERARRDLRRFGALPPDAPEKCRCGSNRYHFLPEAFERQMIDLKIRSDLSR